MWLCDTEKIRMISKFMYLQYVSTAVTCRLWTGGCKEGGEMVISAWQAGVSRMVIQSAFAVGQRQQQGSDKSY